MVVDPQRQRALRLVDTSRRTLRLGLLGRHFQSAGVVVMSDTSTIEWTEVL